MGGVCSKLGTSPRGFGKKVSCTSAPIDAGSHHRIKTIAAPAFYTIRNKN